jgi:hypothetical protein
MRKFKHVHVGECEMATPWTQHKVVGVVYDDIITHYNMNTVIINLDIFFFIEFGKVLLLFCPFTLNYLYTIT